MCPSLKPVDIRFSLCQCAGRWIVSGNEKRTEESQQAEMGQGGEMFIIGDHFSGPFFFSGMAGLEGTPKKCMHEICNSDLPTFPVTCCLK